MPPIEIMIKPVSGSCNLNCAYCFYSDEMSHREVALKGVMSPYTVRNLIRKAFIYADEHISFTFQGGEPTLAGAEFYRSFIMTVNEYNARGMEIFYSLQTNATMLTDELCDIFRDNSFIVGVSLDGSALIHDKYRTDKEGVGTYSRTMKGISMLKEKGIEYSVLCVLTEDAARNIRKVFDSLLCHRSVQFIPCIDPLDGSPAPWSLTPETYGRALTEIYDMYKYRLTSPQPVYERRMDNYLSIITEECCEMCGMSGECGGYFLVEADGGVYPCDFYVLDEYILGNINETSFLRMEKSDNWIRFMSEGCRTPEECRGCRYSFICRGGCRRDREPTLGHNKFCESYKYFFDHRLDDFCKLAEKLLTKK